MKVVTTSLVNRLERENLLGQHAHVIWLTGLSGSGKTTLASMLDRRLFESGYKTFFLDGDLVRNGLNRDLGFSIADRTENIRRIGEVNRLFFEAGIITINAFVSPIRADREKLKAMFPVGRFSEIYLNADVAACEARDVKGLYSMARSGRIPEFTGVSSPYEEPYQPDLVLDTRTVTPQESFMEFWTFINGRLR